MAHPLRVLAVTLVVLVGGAGPASADAAGPSDFRSEVTAVTTAAGGVRARILGGDAFLEVSVDEGRTVIVEGYQGEPYLRFQPDGAVQRNRLSPATYINDDRQGEGAIPADAQAADADTPPDWEPVASDGTYAWHDHRVHWMQDASPNVDRGARVEGAYDPWRVPLVVDGAQAEVQGILVYEESISPLPYLGVAVIMASLLAWAAQRRSLRLTAYPLLVVSLVAAVVGQAEYRATPDGGGNPLLWGLAMVAAVAALGAVLLARRRAGGTLALAAVAVLSGWALFRFESLRKPVLPTDLPFVLDRATIALALAVSAAAAYQAVTTGALALPDLPDDEDAGVP